MIENWTDRALIEEIFRRHGIEAEVSDDFLKQSKENIVLLLTAGSHDKVDGYCGFATIFEFTPDGSLARLGAWE